MSAYNQTYTLMVIDERFFTSTGVFFVTPTWANLAAYIEWWVEGAGGQGGPGA